MPGHPEFTEPLFQHMADIDPGESALTLPYALTLVSRNMTMQESELLRINFPGRVKLANSIHSNNEDLKRGTVRLTTQFRLRVATDIKALTKELTLVMKEKPGAFKAGFWQNSKEDKYKKAWLLFFTELLRDSDELIDRGNTLYKHFDNLGIKMGGLSNAIGEGLASIDEGLGKQGWWQRTFYNKEIKQFEAQHTLLIRL